jgi:hypothetical protein
MAIGTGILSYSGGGMDQSSAAVWPLALPEVVSGPTSELKMPDNLLLDLPAFLNWTSLDVLLVAILQPNSNWKVALMLDLRSSHFSNAPKYAPAPMLLCGRGGLNASEEASRRLR